MEESKEHLETLLTEYYGARRLHIRSDDDIEAKIKIIVDKGLGDFCWSLDFSESFLRRLLFHGFLPICTRIPPAPLFVLLPKLHRRRCVLRRLSGLHVDRGAKKRSRRYHLTVNASYPEVVLGCIEQHGESWLWPPMREALAALWHSGCSDDQMDVSHSAGAAREIDSSSKPLPVRLKSIELWTEDRKLVAGELGYTCGSMYTSLTGFYNEPGTGSVQMLALAGLLVRGNFQCWDLGMGMRYKERLGAEDLDRGEFIALQRSLRCDESARMPCVLTEWLPAVELIKGLCAVSEEVAPVSEESALHPTGKRVCTEACSQRS